MAKLRVEIVDYDPEWATLYREERARILGVIGHLQVAVEHLVVRLLLVWVQSRLLTLWLVWVVFLMLSCAWSRWVLLGMCIILRLRCLIGDSSVRVNRRKSSIIMCIWLRRMVSFGRGIWLFVII
jgi:hypothetical protein